MKAPLKVLVTGATGQIGYMGFKRLKDQPERYEAFALDQKREPSARVPQSWTLDVPDEKFHLCSLTDFAGIQRAVQGMDVVVHLAAGPNGESWESVLNSNVIGTYHIFVDIENARLKVGYVPEDRAEEHHNYD